MNNEQSNALSLDEAADILSSKEAESEDQPIPEEPEPEAETEEETEEETEAEEAQEEGETEADEDAEEESEEQAEEETPKYVTEGLVEIDGEDVDIQELKQGHLRQQDYTRKTQQVAEDRKAAEQQRQQYESQLNALSVAAGTNLGRYTHMTETDWQQMALQKPDDFKRHRADYDKAIGYQQFLNNQVAENNAKNEQQRDGERKAQAADALQTLKATIPNWSNDLYSEIGEYAKTQGVDADEFADIIDHRLITVLHKARQFDKAKKVTKKKIASSPKKTLTGGKATTKPANQKTKKAMKRLSQSGSMDDALEAFMNR
jgi:hypothetical protein